MPCTQCMSPYTVFRKEHGCSNCGYGFCEKCLQQKWVLPSISSKPLSVCASCYNMLSGKGQSQKQCKDRDDDDWPPPSLRQNYPIRSRNSQNDDSGGTQNQSRIAQDKSSFSQPQAHLDRKNDDLDEIHARLAKLKEVPIEDVKNPGAMFYPTPSGQNRTNNQDEVKGLIEAYSNLPKYEYESSKEKNDAEVAKIEERLAALKGVPVEEVRNPRVWVNDVESDSDISMSEDAQELLKQAEEDARFKKSEHCYKNEALDEDDVSMDSIMLKKIIKEAEDTPSIDSRTNPFLPEFEDTVRQARLQAEEAERRANDFIRQSQEQNDPQTPRPENYGNFEEQNKDPKSPDAAKKKAGLFSRLFKTSKD